MNFFEIVDWYEKHAPPLGLCAIRDVQVSTYRYYREAHDKLKSDELQSYVADSLRKKLYVEAALKRVTGQNPGN